jgi:hypothetical protein
MAMSQPDASIRRATPVTSHDPDERQIVLQSLACSALAATTADGAAIALGNDQAMVCTASVGTAPPIGTEVRRNDLGPSAHSLRTSDTIVCVDTWTDLRCDSFIARKQETRSVAIVPIFTVTSPAANSEMIGLLEVFSRQPHAFHAPAIEQLQCLTATLADLFELGEPAIASSAGVSAQAA